MATNKVVYNGKTLIDLSSDTVTANTLVEGITAHNKAGNVVTGTCIDSYAGKYVWKIYSGKIWDVTDENLGRTRPSDMDSAKYCQMIESNDGYLVLKEGSITGDLSWYSYKKSDINSSEVKSVYRKEWHAVYNGNPYDDYHLITIGSTYTEGKGALLGYISSYFSNRYPDDGLKNGYYYVKVNTSGSSSSSSNNNCEAYLVDVTNPTVSFKTTSGTIKAYGYAYETTKSQWGGSTNTTMYAFNGTNYYKSAVYGSPTAINITLGVSGGKLTGLPNLTSGTLLVTKGI